MADEAGKLRVERLCGHHVVEGFSCGDSTWDIELGDLVRRVNDGGETMTFVLVDHANTVGAYVAISEVTIRKMGDENGEVQHYICIPAIAVTQEWQGSGAAGRLVRKVVQVARNRQDDFLKIHGERRYHGVLCIPHTNERLEEVLRKLKFYPLPDNAFYWVRHLPGEKHD